MATVILLSSARRLSQAGSRAHHPNRVTPAAGGHASMAAVIGHALIHRAAAGRAPRPRSAGSASASRWARRASSSGRSRDSSRSSAGGADARVSSPARSSSPWRRPGVVAGILGAGALSTTGTGGRRAESVRRHAAVQPEHRATRAGAASPRSGKIGWYAPRTCSVRPASWSRGRSPIASPAVTSRSDGGREPRGVRTSSAWRPSPPCGPFHRVDPRPRRRELEHRGRRPCASSSAA